MPGAVLGPVHDRRTPDAGQAQLPPNLASTYASPPTCTRAAGLIVGGRHGGFQAVARVKADFAYALPDNLDSAVAAPLLCAGITGVCACGGGGTLGHILLQCRGGPEVRGAACVLVRLAAVYAPIKKWVRPGMHVAVLGCGGLGHLALQVSVHACVRRAPSPAAGASWAAEARSMSACSISISSVPHPGAEAAKAAPREAGLVHAAARRHRRHATRPGPWRAPGRWNERVASPHDMRVACACALQFASKVGAVVTALDRNPPSDKEQQCL